MFTFSSSTSPLFFSHLISSAAWDAHYQGSATLTLSMSKPFFKVYCPFFISYLIFSSISSLPLLLLVLNKTGTRPFVQPSSFLKFWTSLSPGSFQASKLWKSIFWCWKFHSCGLNWDAHFIFLVILLAKAAKATSLCLLGGFSSPDPLFSDFEVPDLLLVNLQSTCLWGSGQLWQKPTSGLLESFSVVLPRVYQIGAYVFQNLCFNSRTFVNCCN